MNRERPLGLHLPGNTLYKGMSEVLRRRQFYNNLPQAGRKRLSRYRKKSNIATTTTPQVESSTIFAATTGSPTPENATSRLEEHVEPLCDVFGNVLYDLARVIQGQSSTYDAFDVLYRAVHNVRQQQQAIRAVKRLRVKSASPVGIYHQLLSRRMGRRSVEAPMISRQLRRASSQMQRAINIWGHHCSLDEIDPNKPYNEPPQVRCIRFDKTGDVIITGGDEGIIKLWHSYNCTLITSLRKHAGGVVSIDVHPNNIFILSCCDGGEMWLWEINGNLYRPHKRVSSQFKFLWCRFLSTGVSQGTCPSGFSDRCKQEIENTLVVCITADSKLSIYRMADLIVSSSGSNIISDVVPLYTVDMFNHNIKAYDISRPLMHDNSCLIAVGIEPMYLEELRMSDDTITSALMFLHKEASNVATENIRGKYGQISSSASCALFNISTCEFIKTSGIVSLVNGLSEDDMEQMSQHQFAQEENTVECITADGYCCCDIDMSFAVDSASICKYCFKRVRTLAYPLASSYQHDGSIDTKLFPSVENNDNSMVIDGLVTLKKTTRNNHATKAATTAPNVTTSSNRNTPDFSWDNHCNDLEKYIRTCLDSYTLDDSPNADTINFGEYSMPIGRKSSRLVFPSHLEQSYASFDGTNRDPGNFDDLIYHVDSGHELSPDVCFANCSLNHVTGSDDGKLFLWTHCGNESKFRSTQLFTKCVSKWLCQPDKLPQKITSVPNVIDPAFHGLRFDPSHSVVTATVDLMDDASGSGTVTSTHTISNRTVTQDVEMSKEDLEESEPKGLFDSDTDVDFVNNENANTKSRSSLSSTKSIHPATIMSAESVSMPLGDTPEPDYPEYSLGDSDVYISTEDIRPCMMDSNEHVSINTTAELFNEGDVGKQPMSESGHHYVITEIAWSLNDSYIFIADSIVTRYNVKKLITASRTILSGVSVFTPDGNRIADFLHNEISHHVGCVKPHPITEDLLLTITYGGVIYVLSVESKSIVRKLDCGPNAVWVDAEWHPNGLYFAASQSYGCFSVFAMDNLVANYSGTMNHQCGYSDMLPINTTAFYTGIENNNQVIRRYYYGSTLMPPLELPGKGYNESLRIYTSSSYHTVLDDNRCEVLYACSPVSMQVKDTQLWSNRLSEINKLSRDDWLMVCVLSRFPLELGIIEFLQWHLTTYDSCDVDELIFWFISLYGLDSIVDFSKQIRRATCPYGGMSCTVCHYITSANDRAERYASIVSEYRGVKSRTNDRGDIIACLPLSARPQSAVPASHTSTNSIERRSPIVSPIRRGAATRTTVSTRSPVVNTLNPIARSTTRTNVMQRPQPTRIQPPRGRAADRVLNTSQGSNASNTDPETVRSSPRRSLRNAAARSQASTSLVIDDETIVSPRPTRSNVSTPPSRHRSDERMVRRLRREMRTIVESSSDESTPETHHVSYSLRKRRGSGYIEHARHVSEIIGPIGLSKSHRQDVTTTEGLCVLCGLGDDINRSKRGPNRRLYIGGSKLTKNALVGPFVTSQHNLEVLSEELPRVYDRLGNTIVIHIGCLSATNELSLDNNRKMIYNLPEVLTSAMNVKCSYCNGPFATLHCSDPNCDRAFHFPCALLCLDDDSYKQRQPAASSHPELLDSMNNTQDPLLSDHFFCLDCTLNRCADAHSLYGSLCSGDVFLREEPRSWFISDVKPDSTSCYIPQGGELILVPPQDPGSIKANIGSIWSLPRLPQLLEIKKIDYVFYGRSLCMVTTIDVAGPVSDNCGICSVLSLRQLDNTKRVSLFYYPGAFTVLPLIDLLVGLWRMSQVSKGQSIKVRVGGEWHSAVLREVEPGISTKAGTVVPGDYSMANVATIACTAMDIGNQCVKVEPISGIDNVLFNAWDISLDNEQESSLLDALKQPLFPPEAKEHLINLTLDPDFEDFNVLPAYGEGEEPWLREYWQTIPCPMSLERVRQRILNSYYICPQGCFSDLELIVSNCRLFNDASSEICQRAQTLERAISSTRDDVRRSMSADKYAKHVVQTLWSDIEPYFTASASQQQPNTLDASTSSIDLQSFSGNKDATDDDEMPFRPSRRLRSNRLLPLPIESSPRSEPVESNVPPAIEHTKTVRRSRRLSQVSTESNEPCYTEDRGDEDTKIAATLSNQSRRSSRVINESEVVNAVQPMEYRRASARLASIAQQEIERARELELEAQRLERETKMRRLSTSRYNFRQR
ncbi:WD G-beta repeat-containing protein protein, putative [Babesia ovis]|uniref:WD G-beta repeat-containing protein protein, putative n=1 Tax=Babesia ovis TaxID=5869 RepID=A0A9W5TDA9_BABOV|nr:WD G-beta repeat-containing protein protein, putative [Babesia ovis]